MTEETNAGSTSNHVENKSREERLLETIVTSGGVRLQPTREMLQAFLSEATKLDALALSQALESKLLSPLWQVRMKAVCVLEAILRKKDVEQFFIMESYFVENYEVIVRCTESPQASLREKLMKVLNLLVGEQNGSVTSHLEKPIKAEKAISQMPDLIDTSGPEDYNIMELEKPQSAPILIPNTSSRPIIDDLFSDGLTTGPIPSEHKQDDDPFADVSFHINENKEHNADIFSGLSVDQPEPNVVNLAANGNGPELFDIFGSNSGISQQMENNKQDVADVIAGLSIKEGTTPQNGNFTESILGSTTNPSQQAPEFFLNGMLAPQSAGVNGNTMFPLGPMAYNMPPGFMFNPAVASQTLDYGDISSILAQQQQQLQLLATMSNFQQMGNLQSQSSGANISAGNIGGLSSSPLPDIFNPSLLNQTPTSLMNSSKKEDTKAFDFISELLFSYNIVVDRSNEMCKVLGKSAASVGLQLPQV